MFVSSNCKSKIELDARLFVAHLCFLGSQDSTYSCFYQTKMGREMCQVFLKWVQLITMNYVFVL